MQQTKCSVCPPKLLDMARSGQYDLYSPSGKVSVCGMVWCRALASHEKDLETDLWH